MAEKRKKLPLQQALELFRQLMSQLAFCHNQGQVHTHLTPENTFISKGNNDKLAISFVGLGSATCAQPTITSNISWDGFRCDTQKFSSPQKIDIFSAANIAILLIGGKSALIQFAKDFNLPEEITQIHPLREIFEKCLGMRSGAEQTTQELHAEIDNYLNQLKIEQREILISDLDIYRTGIQAIVEANPDQKESLQQPWNQLHDEAKRTIASSIHTAVSRNESPADATRIAPKPLEVIKLKRLTYTPPLEENKQLPEPTQPAFDDEDDNEPTCIMARPVFTKPPTEEKPNEDVADDPFTFNFDPDAAIRERIEALDIITQSYVLFSNQTIIKKTSKSENEITDISTSQQPDDTHTSHEIEALEQRFQQLRKQMRIIAAILLSIVIILLLLLLFK